MDQKPVTKRFYSRRDFLKGIPLGIGGIFALAMVSRRLFSFRSRRPSQPPVFPEGSIFTPAKNRRRKT